MNCVFVIWFCSLSLGKWAQYTHIQSPNLSPAPLSLVITCSLSFTSHSFPFPLCLSSTVHLHLCPQSQKKWNWFCWRLVGWHRCRNLMVGFKIPSCIAPSNCINGSAKTLSNCKKLHEIQDGAEYIIAMSDTVKSAKRFRGFVQRKFNYTLRRLVIRKVLSTRIWGVPPAGGPLL